MAPFQVSSRRLAAILLGLSGPVSTHATYSIIACDDMSGACGVAVQTDNLAVGASVPYAQADVGAIASQFETNPRHGPRGLALLAEGRSASDTLTLLLREDGNFEGRGVEARQLAVVAMNGQAYVHTGTDAVKADWAGARTGNGYSIQGNGLAGPHVLEAMEQTFLTTPGPLADRLLAALAAGDRAGGQRSGRESAALLLRTRDGFPLDIDLRVDHADDPIAQLRFLYGLHTVRQQIIAARIAGRRGNIDEGRALLRATLALAVEWPRASALAAEVALELEQPDLALELLTHAFERNPARIPVVLGSGIFALLGAEPRFHRWVTPEIAQVALAKGSDRAAASVLLEAGHSSRALAVLLASAPTNQSAEDFLLLATAHEALGDAAAAIAVCDTGLQHHPQNQPLTLRRSRLRPTQP